MIVRHEQLLNRLRKRGYEVVKLSRYQYRVECVLDLYPVRGRWHNIANNQRGSWLEMSKDDKLMVSFIDAQVAIADGILDEELAKQGGEAPVSQDERKRYMAWKPAFAR